MIQRVIFPFRGAELGGSHIAAFTLASGLKALGPKNGGIDCVVLAPEGTLILKEASRLGFTAVASGEAPTGKNNLVTDFTRTSERQAVLAKLKMPSHGNGGTIVHTSDINSLRAWGPAAKALGLGVVYHHHALNRMWWPPHLRGLSFADAVIGVSEATLETIKPVRSDAVKELNPFDIDMGLDKAAAREALRAEHGWRKDALIVGWVGNMWGRKRPKFFLETAARLFWKEPRCRFVMYGRDGDHSVDEMRDFAASVGMAAVTVLPGFRQPAEANIASLDLLFAPATREPFGRTLVEAIILGVPVLATRGAGHTEIITRWGGGELAPEEASAAEAASLAVSTMEKAKSLVLPGERRAEIAAELSSAAHAERVLAIYRGVMDRSAERRAA
jgi:glycosyltransferase involved in cell wall biosynthesis